MFFTSYAHAINSVIIGYRTNSVDAMAEHELARIKTEVHLLDLIINDLLVLSLIQHI